LDRGSIVADGSPDDIIESDYQMVKDFLRISFRELKSKR